MLFTIYSFPSSAVRKFIEILLKKILKAARLAQANSLLHYYYMPKGYFCQHISGNFFGGLGNFGDLHIRLATANFIFCLNCPLPIPMRKKGAVRQTARIEANADRTDSPFDYLTVTVMVISSSTLRARSYPPVRMYPLTV